MHEMVRGHVKQRFVAENGALDNHCRDGGDDRRSEKRGIHVANNFLQRKQHRGHWCVERCSECTRGPDRDEIAHTTRRQAQPLADQ